MNGEAMNGRRRPGGRQGEPPPGQRALARGARPWLPIGITWEASTTATTGCSAPGVTGLGVEGFPRSPGDSQMLPILRDTRPTWDG